MMLRAFLCLPLALCACAGPIQTRSGYIGSPEAARGIESIALADSPTPMALAEAAHTTVQTALIKRGMRILPDAPARLTVSLAERPADMAVLSDDGTLLSGAKTQRLLQSCTDRIQRIVLVVEQKEQPPVRAWAEESHCNGQLADTLPILANSAVDALYRKGGAVTLRKGRD